MHGAGNDFVVLDGVRQTIEMTPERARALGDRHSASAPTRSCWSSAPPGRTPISAIAFSMPTAARSSIAATAPAASCASCMNRACPTRTRCAPRSPPASWCWTKATTSRSPWTWAAPLRAVRPCPSTPPAWLRASKAGHAVGAGTRCPRRPAALGRSIGGGHFQPHAVQVVDDVDAFPVGVIGPLVETHARFPRRVSAGFMRVVDRNNIRLRVHERGAGETLACGTGACAAVAAGIRRGLLGRRYASRRARRAHRGLGRCATA